MVFVSFAILKAADDISTFFLVSRFSLAGEANALPAFMFTFGPIGYFALWLFVVSIFTAGYFMIRNLRTPVPLPKGISGFMLSLYLTIVFGYYLIVVANNLNLLTT